MRKILGFVLIVACVSAGAYETTPRSISLGKYGALEIRAPIEWQDSLQRATNDRPASIKLTPKSGARFEIYVTPFSPEAANGRGETMSELRRLAREAANAIAAKSIERPIELKELRSATSNGYYFTATEFEPKADGFKYTCQGIIGVGQLRVMFVILTNEGQEKIVKEAHAMVFAAVHR